MDLGIREWMLLIGGALFLAVVVDGLRRVLADKREEVRLSRRAKKGFQDDGGELPNHELPGSARVKPRITEQNVYEKDVPVLLDAVDEDELNNIQEETANKILDDKNKPLDKSDQVEPAPAVVDAIPEQVALPLETEQVATPKEIPENNDTASDEPLGEVEEVIVINAHAKPGQSFNGKTMLESLLSLDLRFGSMDIFHKREGINGKQRIQFSVANSVEPGTFSLDDIDNFSTAGITFFMQLPGPAKPMEAFKDMLSSADTFVKALDGLLLDEQRNIISQQTLEHIKQQVEDFERRSLAKRN